MADPLLIGAGVNLGSTLLSGLLGGDSPSDEASKIILEFAKRGYPPEVLSEMISKAMASVNAGVGQAKSGAAARLSAGGIDPTSGLAQERFGAIERAGLQQRGGIVSNIKMDEFSKRLGAAQSLLGFQGGFDPLETIAGASGNLLPLLALRGNK